MNNKQQKQVIQALVSFVVRVTQEAATPEEIAVLPEVAQVLLKLDQIFWKGHLT